MNTKHTPGPWFANDTTDPQYIDITTDPDGCDASIAHVFWKNAEFPEFGGTGEANAQLIARAWLIPELLDSLSGYERMANKIISGEKTPQDFDSLKSALQFEAPATRAIIAKAEEVR